MKWQTGTSNPIRTPRLTPSTSKALVQHTSSLSMVGLPLVAFTLLQSNLNTTAEWPQHLNFPPLLKILQRLNSLSAPSPYTASPDPFSTGPIVGLKTRTQDPPPLYTVLNAKNNFYIFKRLKKLKSTVCCDMRILYRIQIPVGTTNHTEHDHALARAAPALLPV